MFGTVIDKINTLLSGSFAVGNFFPVLVIATLNYSIATIAFSGVDFFTSTGTGWTKLLQDTPEAVLAGMGVAIVAYVLGPLIPVFRSFLEGRHLPAPIRRAWVQTWTEKRNELAGQAKTAKHLVVRFRRLRDYWIQTLQTSRKPKFLTTPLAQTDLVSARAAMTKLKNEVGRNGLPEEATLEAAAKAVNDAFSKGPSSQDALFAELDGYHDAINNELRAAADVAQLRSDEAAYQLRSRFASDVKPTRIGNTRAAMERYPTTAYNVDFDFLWPRLGIVLKKEADGDVITKALNAVTAKLDAAVLLTVLTALSAVVWMFVLAFFGTSICVYLLVVIGGSAAVYFFYVLTDETQKAFGEVLIMVIDARRHELLTTLHQRIPKSLKAEQETWQNLQRALYAEGSLDVRFTHKPGDV